MPKPLRLLSSGLRCPEVPKRLEPQQEGEDMGGWSLPAFQLAQTLGQVLGGTRFMFLKGPSGLGPCGFQW